jgi:hypothetical protein
MENTGKNGLDSCFFNHGGSLVWQAYESKETPNQGSIKLNMKALG